MGLMLLAVLTAFSTPAMSTCTCGVATNGCPCACGTSGFIEGTVYTSGGEPPSSAERIYHWDFDDIPDGANITWARLYWHIWMPGDRTVATFGNATGCTDRTIDISDKVNCNQNENEGFYYGGFGTGWVYWNVTDLVTSGTNNATIDNAPDGYPADDGRTFQMYLVVVYEKDGYPQTHYWVNQGYTDIIPGQSHTTNFAGTASDATNGTLWQLGLAHNALVNIRFNTNLVAATTGQGTYGLLEEYEIPASWINTVGGNTMTWEDIADEHHHPALAIFMDRRPMANTTRGGNPIGVPVRKTWLIHQNKYDYATDFHFKLWIEQDNVDINGWDVDISHFPVVDSTRGNQPSQYHGNLYNIPGIPATSDSDNGMHAIDIIADGGNVSYCTWVKVTITMWLTDYNVMAFTDIKWTKEGGELKAKPDHGWDIDWPTPDPLNPGQYLHRFTITNYDAVDTYDVSELAFNATMDWYDDIETIGFPSPHASITLAPGESWYTDISTSGSDFVGGYIYFKYVIDGSTEWLAHPIVGNTKIIVEANIDFDRLVSEGRATEFGGTYYIKDQMITNTLGDGITIKNTNVPYVIDNCTIYDCTGGGSGVFLNNVTGGTISNCNIHDNQHYGIKVGAVTLDSTDPKFVNITCNTIYQNYVDGIDLIGFDCIVKGNTVSDNAIYGLYVFGNDNKIYNNTIEDNNNYGIKLYDSSGNDIYRNDISNNNGSGVQGYDDTTANTWRTPTVVNYCYSGNTYDRYTGNYWSDYIGSDPDNDGIGNDAYALDGGAGATDPYPAMVQWGLCGDVNRDGFVDSTDIGLLEQKVWHPPKTLCCAWAGDVNCDDFVDSTDIGLLDQKVWHPPKTLCCCKGC